METRAIAAEYNPFHYGHQWQLEQIRTDLGQDTCIIAIMSGDHVQRGGPAVLGKYRRTALALAQGVDLVLELPAIFATQSAQYFADGVLRTLEATGICRDQVAGAGFPGSPWYERIPPVLIEEPPLYREALQGALADGKSFAAARAEGLVAVLGPEVLPFLTSSNDNLNLAYRVAALRYSPQTRFHPLPRVDGSATTVRERLAALTDRSRPSAILRATAGLVPTGVAAELAEAAAAGELVLEQDAFAPIAMLLRGRSEAELAQHPGMDEGLAALLKKLVAASGPASESWDGLLAAATSKRYPTSRVRRALFSALLGITQADLDAASEVGPQYLRVLGFSKRGRYALRLMRKLAKLPIITRESDVLEYSGLQTPHLRRQAALDAASTDIRSYLAGGGGGTAFAETVIMR